MGKNISIKERILTFLERESIKKVDFFMATGIKDGNFKGKNMESQPGGDMLVKILSTYPEISADWLLTGQGSMLRTDTTPTEPTTPTITPSISHAPSQGKPYYDVDFLAGFNEIFNDQTTLPMHNIIVPGFEKAQLWCNATGHSMAPKINHGDIIALRQCTLDDVQYGEIYAVVLDTIRTIKILRKGSKPSLLRFIPINTADFDEQEYDITRIINVFEVIGSISRFF